MSHQDTKIIDASAPFQNDSDQDEEITKALELSLIQTHGGASSSAPQGDRNPSTQQEEEGLGEEDRMMEDTDIDPTFKMPATETAEENLVERQVPQPSESAHSERGQTETNSQNDTLEEDQNEQRITVEEPLVRKHRKHLNPFR